MPNDSTAPTRVRTILLRSAGLFALGIALTGFFIYLGFPYDRLAEGLSQRVEATQEFQIRYGAVTAQPHWLGPGISVEDIAIVPSGGESIALDEIFVRPAWSFSWFRGVPSIHVRATSGAAHAGIEVTLDDPLRLRGEIHDLDLQQLPSPGALAKAALGGIAEVEFDIEKPVAENWQGTARLGIEDGSFSPPDLKLAIPYESLRSALSLTPDGFLEIAETRMQGPMISGSAEGRIGVASGSTPGPLDVNLDLEVLDPTLQNALRNNKIAVTTEGVANLHFGGTLAKPIIR